MRQLCMGNIKTLHDTCEFKQYFSFIAAKYENVQRKECTTIAFSPFDNSMRVDLPNDSSISVLHDPDWKLVPVKLYEPVAIETLWWL